MNRVSDLLERERSVILDGGLATELHRAGIAMQAPRWSAQALFSTQGRAAVAQCHSAFLQAGADVITANTFRTNLRALRRVGGNASAAECLTRVAVELADEAVSACGRGTAVVAASVAPVEDCYDPSAVPDDLTLEVEHGFFASLLAQLGVELALIETMNCVREAVIATRAARGHGITPWVSFVAGADARLLSGESVADAAVAVAREGAQAVLVNCCDLAVTRPALAALQSCGLPIGAYPNIEDRSEADSLTNTPLPASLGPVGFAVALTGLIRDFSLSIAGGCCGATPAHIRNLAGSIKRLNEGVLT